MDTVMQFDAYGGSANLQEKVKRRVEELEGEFSTTQENSDIFYLNQEKTAKLSDDTRYLMQEALALGAETDGALDISIYPVVQSWGFTTGNYRVPSESERESLLKSVDYRLVGLEADTASIEPGMMVDLGGVGKGFTGDEVVKTMKEDGVTSALFSLGGNIQTIGTKPDGEKWYVGIKDPESDGYLGGVRVQDEAVITSGGYERYFTDDDGTIYWHIMDPSTGAPAHSGLISVTIIGPCGLRCDGLSTALFVMGREKAAAHWAAHQDYEAVLVDEGGTIWLTPGLKDRFIPVDQGETREIRIL
ncbi:FAD:protein FMN transferase [Clostridium sp. TF06-15AC]|uniref:FAD:protein FMN transferase n=2 Tax=Clostridiaceae TaxID=31979 RepID=A0AAW3X3E7_9CLOT|nr:FAD:protein FMN transferase [Clostridium segne]RHU71326.1 FAD:protein FMN transferase [Clostridium sp. TF06-15AC]